MSAIGPGDWVECVDARPPMSGDLSKCVLLGALYQVRDVLRVLDTRNNSLAVGVRLFQIETGGNAWDPRRFRPIYRPKADFIESLKQPIAEGVEA